VATIPVSFAGLTLAALPLALSLEGIMNGITRPFFGWVSDYIGRENKMFVAFSLEAAAKLLLIRFAHDPVLFVLFSSLTFFAWGEIYSLLRIDLDMLVVTASPARTALKNSQLTCGEAQGI